MKGIASGGANVSGGSAVCRRLRGVAEGPGLVVDLNRDLSEPSGVLAPMVRAEEQIPTTGKHRTDECPRPAAVAAVGGGQWRCRSGGVHRFHTTPCGRQGFLDTPQD